MDVFDELRRGIIILGFDCLSVMYLSFILLSDHISFQMFPLYIGNYFSLSWKIRYSYVTDSFVYIRFVRHALIVLSMSGTNW